MRVTVHQHNRWRYERYRDLLDGLAQQGRSLASFVSGPGVPADLLEADHLQVHVDPDFLAEVEDSLQQPDDRALEPRGETDLAAIRIAQSDPELDLVSLTAWWRHRAPRLARAIRRVLEQSVEERRGGPGGEDVAFQLGLSLVAVLRRRCQGRRDVMAALAVLQAELDRLAESRTGASLPPQFGLRWMLLGQPVALGVDPYELARSALGFYGTDPLAMQWARRILTEPVEEVPLQRTRDAIARRLQLGPQTILRLARGVLLERLRDALLAALDLGSRHGRVDAWLQGVRRAACSQHRLTQDAFNSRRRAALAQALRSGTLPRSVLQKIEALLEEAAELAGGQVARYGQPEWMTAPSQRMAEAALNLRLDELVGQRLGLARVNILPDGGPEYRAGRALGLGVPAPHPAYHFRPREERTTACAQLYTDRWAPTWLRSEFCILTQRLQEAWAHREGLQWEETGPHRWCLHGPTLAVLTWAMELRRRADALLDRTADRTPEAVARRAQLETRIHRLRLRAEKTGSPALLDEIGLLRQELLDLRDRPAGILAIALARASHVGMQATALQRAVSGVEAVGWANSWDPGPTGLRVETAQLQIQLGSDPHGGGRAKQQTLVNRGLAVDQSVLQGVEDQGRREAHEREGLPPRAHPGAGQALRPVKLWVSRTDGWVFRGVGAQWWEWLAPEHPWVDWALRPEA